MLHFCGFWRQQQLGDGGRFSNAKAHLIVNVAFDEKTLSPLFRKLILLD